MPDDAEPNSSSTKRTWQVAAFSDWGSNLVSTPELKSLFTRRQSQGICIASDPFGIFVGSKRSPPARPFRRRPAVTQAYEAYQKVQSI
jgi:hypothetical protein